MSALPEGVAPAPLPVLWFDGVRGRPHTVHLSVLRQGREAWVLVTGTGEDAGLSQRIALDHVRWPERQRHGQRLAHVEGGGTFSSDDGPAWDAWARASGLKQSRVVWAQQSWHAVAVLALATVAGLAALWLWGVPAAAAGVLALTPASIDQRVGAAAFEEIDKRWFGPSQLPAAQQRAITQRFEQAVQRAFPDEARRPRYQLHFRGDRPRPAGRQVDQKPADKPADPPAQTPPDKPADQPPAGPAEPADERPGAERGLGPNALALPGGHIVLTDAMAQLLAAHPDTLTGVLAHELGHVRHRHGMRMLVQASLLGLVAGLVVGDFSSLLATVPTVLGQQAYSRDFEREADAQARELLRANRLPPSAMVVLFDQLATERKAGRLPGWGLPIALASHPDDEERRRFFSQP
jgi:Zn-dependent protease with chaperone function